jgi:FkbM family methyltransferase
MRQFLIKYFPILGRYKRFLVGILHSLFIRSTYSQYGEDIFFIDFLNINKIEVDKFIYVDIGANHPTDISNTYLLYIKGMSGIVMEPNNELCRLFKRFRKRDTVLNIGCYNSSTILKFNVSKTPVLSSFKNEWQDSDIYKSYYIPVMCLDDALKNMGAKEIFLLNIDVEGLNYQVLEGAVLTLKRTLLVCLEWDETEEKKGFGDLLGPDFKYMQDFGCNSIYLNKTMYELIN